jgi:NADPH-dependent glutamate synthase beta subunit-like oxidoreductase
MRSSFHRNLERILGLSAGHRTEGCVSGSDVPGGNGEGRRGAARPQGGIIGGGNAAIDSARTALRKGADVTVFYRRERKDMPAIEEETQAAKDEGAKFVFLAAPHRVIGDAAGKVKSIEIVKTRLGEYDASGRRKPISTDEIRRYECDSVIFAVGESVDLDFARASGLSLKESGTIEVNRFTLETSRPRFYGRRGRGYGRIERVERDGVWQTGGSQY